MFEELEEEHVYEVNPRCPHCGQPIFSNQEWTYRYGDQWHEDCAIDDDDSDGVREPRKPGPHTSSDGVELEFEEEEDPFDSLNRIPLTVTPSREI